MDIEQVVDAWRVNNAVNIALLSVCTDDDLELKPGKGKTIRSNFVHLISVRKMWAETKLKSQAAEIPKLDWKRASKKEMLEALEISGKVMADLFRKRDSSNRAEQWPMIGFFAYCIAHEAHHRSQVELALRINGREPDDQFLYGLWDWAKK